MAELLVRAKAHWMDNWKADDVDKLSVDEKRSYEARSRIGDIIVVRPDGWKWGREECLPNFIVVKVPDREADVKHYENSLTETRMVDDKEEEVMLRVRKHYVSEKEVSDRSLEVKDFEEITAVNLRSSVLEKVKDGDTA